ncbi:TPR-like protein [Mytilinidion resinicola]|uniref:TPR-like protein n=1 Tax=Mytilinidion resinicola TaxID=574789 RepID=A0A6A6Y7V5_9PEZI|nr:TPR-like protein [Mytilinidion resinicola]KAF2804921.1 TPR-like protein [Mytilinidion resinicola]
MSFATDEYQSKNDPDLHNILLRVISNLPSSGTFDDGEFSWLPFRRDIDFISRNSLDRVRQICTRPAARAALVGLGGVGKSQIAIEYAYLVQDESPTTWVFWVHADTRATFEEGYRKIVQVTKMDGWDNPKADVLQLVQSWLCDESNGRWVMIVDNADDSNVLFPPFDEAEVAGASNPDQAAEPLSDFLPQSPNGSILITSRSRDVARRLTGRGDRLVEVKPMDSREALALLQKKLSNANEHNATELLKALDYMPLAITQAAAHIEQRAPRMTISRYIDEIHRNDHDRARLLARDVGDNRRDGRASNSIIATLQVSFEHIRRGMPTAARLLSLMRHSHADKLFLNWMSLDGREFEMHRLVQFSIKKWLEVYNELEEWKEAYITLMDDNDPVGRYKNWAVCQALFPHARAVVACQPAGGRAVEAWASVLFKAAWYAYEMGKYKEAEEMSQGALEAREAALGAEHPDTLASMNNLATGKCKEAENMDRKVLEAREKTLGREHPSTLMSMNNLALVLQEQGKYEQTEGMNGQALEGWEKVLGKEHPDTLMSMNNLATVLKEQGKYQEAEKMNRQALEMRKKVLGEEHPDTLRSLNNLALVLQEQGKYKQAEEMNRQVLEGWEKVLGKEHPDTLRSVYNLAYLLHQLQQYKDASPLYQRACAGLQEKLGLDHPITQGCMSNYSLLQRQWTP